MQLVIMATEVTSGDQFVVIPTEVTPGEQFVIIGIAMHRVDLSLVTIIFY